jgi:hypothetical protein
MIQLETNKHRRGCNIKINLKDVDLEYSNWNYLKRVLKADVCEYCDECCGFVTQINVSNCILSNN